MILQMNKNTKITVLECTKIVNKKGENKDFHIVYLLFYRDQKIKSTSFQSCSYNPQKEDFSLFFKEFLKSTELQDLSEKQEFAVNNYIQVFKKENPNFHFAKHTRSIQYLMEVKGKKI